MIAAESISALKNYFREDQISKSEASNPFGNSGDMVVFPETEEEIAAVLKHADSNGLTITIMGGGTKRGFGGLTEKTDILLSLEKYTGIVEHTPGDMTLTVKAGTRFKDLQDYLAQHNQKISLDPYWPENATIGGIIAANESGPKRLGYGSARDAVIGLRTVYPDGKVIRSGGRVVKNVAGYDMNKLFIGAMGTLGVISEITLKLRPIPKCESLVLVSFPKGNQEGTKAFAVKVLDSMIEPVSLELLNPVLSDKLAGINAYTIAMSFEDVESSVRYQEEFVRNMLPDDAELFINPKEKAELFWHRFYRHIPNGLDGELPIQTEATLKIGTVNLEAVSVLKETELLQDRFNVKIESHGGLGHGLSQVTIRGAESDVANAVTLVRQIAEKAGGYAIVKHLPFELRKKVEVWGNKPSYFFLLQGIKTKVDPNKTLNPNRFIGGI
ncbi:FAD-binding oxidoreductase [Paenibacillus sp. FSL R5-0490]|uniref:FAD-binding oxidoreductase n=1 Tax=Bacillales TaxID=1385 RepID=UPI00096E2729|nr:FAD-binding oxidoreductase [Paenibacillus sp. FSL R5-0490]OMF59623.1 FAD-binding oxidoreductase [Paenibacillus sp. FSL R5-0490]